LCKPGGSFAVILRYEVPYDIPKQPVHFTAVTVSRSAASADGVQYNVGFTAKNIRTDLDAMQEMV
jgi:hypothetical protein